MLKSEVVDKEFTKKDDFNECVYLFQPTLKYRKSAQNALQTFNEKCSQIYDENFEKDLEERIGSRIFSNDDELKKIVFDETCILKRKYIDLVDYKDHMELETKLKEEEYEIILNKQ